MDATVLDDRRRLVLPANFKPRSAVTVQPIDEETVLVKIAKPAKSRLVMLLPDVKRLPDDPVWEKTELAFARHAAKNLPPFEE
jgi:hypothetical protein